MMVKSSKQGSVMSNTISRGDERGFTIVEMIVSIVVFAVFFGFLMQAFLTAQSQRIRVDRNAAANELAASILHKYGSVAQLPGAINATTCDNISTGSANPNNIIKNKNAVGTEITIAQDLPEHTSLPPVPKTKQQAFVLYPQGCAPGMPIMVKAVITYNSEAVTRATYIY